MFQDPNNSGFERTYGWAWLLKLQTELLQNPLDETKGWSKTLQPLVDQIVDNYKKFLPALVYPIRSGQHPNTAFGLIFALEYAQGDNRFMCYLTEHLVTLTKILIVF